MFSVSCNANTRSSRLVKIKRLTTSLVKYKIVTMVCNCLHGKAPSYLIHCCTSILDVASQRHLHSASRCQLVVPRHNLSTFGLWASFTFPAAWNCLSDELLEPLLTANSFRQLLKTHLLAE